MFHLDPSYFPALYRNRYQKLPYSSSSRLWKSLCTFFFQNYVSTEDAVLDLGAGRCEFINSIRCGHKIALDMNPELRRYADNNVKTIDTLGEIDTESIDIVFVSSFFEYLRSVETLLATLTEIQRILKPGGKLLITQPNIRFLHGAYWDGLDRNLPLSDLSLAHSLTTTSFQVEEIRARFLPEWAHSHYPQNELFIRFYLMSPLAQWLFGKQAWIVASKPVRSYGEAF